MSDLNRVELSGNLGADPDVRYTQTGKPVANLRVASNRKWKGQDRQPQQSTTWVTVKCWDWVAELAAGLKKGDRVMVIGSLEVEEWTPPGGEKRTQLVLRATDVFKLAFIETTAGGAREPEPTRTGPPQERRPAAPRGAPASAPSNFDDDDIPF